MSANSAYNEVGVVSSDAWAGAGSYPEIAGVSILRDIDAPQQSWFDQTQPAEF